MTTLTEIIRKEFETYAIENHQKPDIRYLDSPLVTKYVKAEKGKEHLQRHGTSFG